MRARPVVVASAFACLLAWGARDASAQSASAADEPTAAHELLPRGWSLRLAGGISQPLADLANDDPRQGWVGGQTLGYALHAGVRIPIMPDLLIRPELSFYGFGGYRDTKVPTLIFDGSGAEPDTVTGDWKRETVMGGLRVHLDYISVDRSFISPFLTGALGLVYMRVDDDIVIEGEMIDQKQDTLGLSASVGVGLLVGAAEIVVEGTFQEPGFTDFGSVSWFTADLSAGFSLPFGR